MHEAYLAQLREKISYLENRSGLPRLENRISGLPYNAEMYSKFGAYSLICDLSDNMTGFLLPHLLTF
jgi:hypothetical protein